MAVPPSPCNNAAYPTGMSPSSRCLRGSGSDISLKQTDRSGGLVAPVFPSSRVRPLYGAGRETIALRPVPEGILYGAIAVVGSAAPLLRSVERRAPKQPVELITIVGAEGEQANQDLISPGLVAVTTAVRLMTASSSGTIDPHSPKRRTASRMTLR
jgi:hypothetical protein